MDLVKKHAFTDKAIAQDKQDNICNTIIQVKHVKLSSYAKKNRVRLNENIESRFMLDAQKNTSTRNHDKKAKFLEKKRLAKV